MRTGRSWEGTARRASRRRERARGELYSQTSLNFYKMSSSDTAEAMMIPSRSAPFSSWVSWIRGGGGIRRILHGALWAGPGSWNGGIPGADCLGRRRRDPAFVEGSTLVTNLSSSGVAIVRRIGALVTQSRNRQRSALR